VTPVVVAHCRAGFEPEAALDLRALAASAGTDVDVAAFAGIVVASPLTFDAPHWNRALDRTKPVFIRSLFIGTGPHALFDPAATKGRPDRVAPLAMLTGAFRADFVVPGFQGPARERPAFAELRLETPDTNAGKELSGLCRSLMPRLSAELAVRGTLATGGGGVQRPRLHVLFVDGSHVYVGASLPPWGSPWPMGIPRLRMPRAAPSRSALKLVEAFVTFLGERELDMLHAGMRAVDLGAAPGGWSWQLAHRGLRVTAVDNGPLKGEIADDPLVTHLRADGLTFVPRRPVDWMVCDIVLQPARIAALVGRWIGEGHARRAIFNLKLPMKKRYDEVRRCESIIRDALDRTRATHTLQLRHLYHDREEVTGYLAREG
jgi:23S rRNA (cytidine2498-2'-O)-methyltransferase